VTIPLRPVVPLRPPRRPPLRLLPLAHRRRTPASRRSSGLRPARSKRRALARPGECSAGETIVQNFETQRNPLQRIKAGQVRLCDALVLDENLKCFAHPFGIDQSFEEKPGAGSLAFAHGWGLQVGESA
jgi:hypothetical protein